MSITITISDIMEYKYGMRLRGFGPGCQPGPGLIRRENANTKKYYDIIVYGRQLSESECDQYSLDDLSVEEK